MTAAPAAIEAPVRRGLSLFARGEPPFGSVLLDLDGCLIDSNEAHARAWSAALKRFGHSVSAPRLRREIGKGGQELIRDFVSPAERHFLGEAMGALQTKLYLASFGARVRAFPGASRAVRGMRRAGLRVVIASSADRTALERALALLNLGGVVDGFTSADDVRKAKPFHDVFSLAISRFGLARLRPVAVGDTPYDVGAAHQIGVACIAVRSGGFPDRSLASADAIYSGVAQLWRAGRELFW